MAIGVQITFDCADPDRLAAFWAEVLGYQVQPPPPGFATWPAFLQAQGIPEEQWPRVSAIIDPQGQGPRIFFQHVPEAKVVKNRVHLDVNVGGAIGDLAERRAHVDTTVERLTSLGASKQGAMGQLGEYWVVLQDPEGNEFCLQ
jgi:catechol 2,3-dioxygenase-like lactoylglutathione lyase family enzyme